MRWVAALVAVAIVLVAGVLALRRQRGRGNGDESEEPVLLSWWQTVVAYGLAGLLWGLVMFALQGEASLLLFGLLFFGPCLCGTDLVLRRWRARPAGLHHGGSADG